MTEYTTHVAIIVPANKRQAASGRVAAWSGDSDSTNVFSVPLNAPAEDIYAKATVAADAAVLDAQNIEGYAYIEVYEDGTATQSQTFYLLAK